MTTPAVAKGKACVGATDCMPGDGACPLPTTSTITTTTVSTTTRSTTTHTDTTTSVTTVTTVTTVLPTIAEVLGTKAKKLAGVLKDQSLLSFLGDSNSQRTIFAPLDRAFNKATLDVYNSMTKGDQKAVLQYHVVSSQALPRAKFQAGDTLTTMGSSSTLELQNSNAGSKWSIFTETDQVVEVLTKPQSVQCSNGVVHFISEVLIPKIEAAEEPPTATTTVPGGGGGAGDTTTSGPGVKTTTTAGSANPVAPAASGSKSADQKKKTIIYAAAGGGFCVLLLIVIVVRVCCRASKGGGGGGTSGIVGAQTFDNPMYDMGDPYGDGKKKSGGGYVPPEYATAGNVQGGNTGYMDVSGAGGGDPGYMDVSGYDENSEA